MDEELAKLAPHFEMADGIIDDESRYYSHRIPRQRDDEDSDDDSSIDSLPSLEEQEGPTQEELSMRCIKDPGSPWDAPPPNWTGPIVVAMNDVDDFDVAARVGTEQALEMVRARQLPANTDFSNINILHEEREAPRGLERSNVLLQRNSWPEPMHTLTFDAFLQQLGRRHGLDETQASTFANRAVELVRCYFELEEIPMDNAARVAADLYNNLQILRDNYYDTDPVFRSNFPWLLLILQGLEQQDSLFVFRLPDNYLLRSHEGYMSYLLRHHPHRDDGSVDPLAGSFEGLLCDGSRFREAAAAAGMTCREGGDEDEDQKQPAMPSLQQPPAPPPPLHPPCVPQNPFPWTDKAKRQATYVQHPASSPPQPHDRDNDTSEAAFLDNMRQRSEDFQRACLSSINLNDRTRAMMNIDPHALIPHQRRQTMRPRQGQLPQLPSALPQHDIQSYEQYHQQQFQYSLGHSILFNSLSWNPGQPPRARTPNLRLASREQQPELNIEDYEAAQGLWFRDIPGTRTTSRYMMNIETGETRRHSHPVNHNRDVAGQSIVWLIAMQRVHTYLFRQDPSTGELHHTLYAHGLHDLQPDYREIYGSGPEPHLGWDYFMNQFIREQGRRFNDGTELNAEERLRLTRALTQYLPARDDQRYSRFPPADDHHWQETDWGISSVEQQVPLSIIGIMDTQERHPSRSAHPHDWDVSLRFRHQRLAGLI